MTTAQRQLPIFPGIDRRSWPQAALSRSSRIKAATPSSRPISSMIFLSTTQRTRIGAHCRNGKPFLAAFRILAIPGRATRDCCPPIARDGPLQRYARGALILSVDSTALVNSMNPSSVPDPSIDRRVQRTHAAVADAVRELFVEEGWDAVTHQRVAERAGYGRNTVYRHFPDRTSLLAHGGNFGDVHHAPITGDLRADLVAELTAFRRELFDGIVGRTTPEDLLDRIFAQFCLGK